MTPALKLNVFFASFPYAGNGGVSSEHPSIKKWYVDTILKCKADPRVGEIFQKDFSDTPITMTRNAAVRAAQKDGAHLMVMVDSDQHPDYYLGVDPMAKPFWDSSFNFLYKHWTKGPSVIGAPYCGPPPHENVYVFNWANWESHRPAVSQADFRVEAFSRFEASRRAGIEPVAALPTGLIMFDMRVFDEVINPAKTLRSLLESGMSEDEARLRTKPWFYYEYNDEFSSEKASTEDVTCTRDISLIGAQKLGYSPVYVNWDAWAGHYKPKCVGKPVAITAEQVNDTYRNALRDGARQNERMVCWQRSPEIEMLIRNGKQEAIA